MPTLNLLSSVLLLPLVLGCAQIREYKTERKMQKVEEATPPFSPIYYKNSENTHFAVKLAITNGVLDSSARGVEIRPGRMPYRSKDAGNVVVTYKAASGKELGRYAVLDQALARSCEADGTQPETKTFTTGTVEVLLPNNPAISFVEVGKVGGRTNVVINVQKPIQDALQNRR